MIGERQLAWRRARSASDSFDTIAGKHSCRNAEIVEAFCGLTLLEPLPVDQFTSRPLLHSTRPPRCPLHFPRFPRYEVMHVASCSPRIYHRERRRHAILIALVAYRVPHSSRLRALALFGRRPVECGPSRCCQCPKTSTQAEMISPSFLNAFVAARAPRVRGWYHRRAAERSGAPGRARSKE